MFVLALWWRDSIFFFFFGIFSVRGIWKWESIQRSPIIEESFMGQLSCAMDKLLESRKMKVLYRRVNLLHYELYSTNLLWIRLKLKCIINFRQILKTVIGKRAQFWTLRDNLPPFDGKCMLLLFVSLKKKCAPTFSSIFFTLFFLSFILFLCPSLFLLH